MGDNSRLVRLPSPWTRIVQHVLTDLEPAVQAGIVQSNLDVSGGFQFTHALIRETIYEDLPAVDRLRLHGRAGDALVGVYSAHLEPALTRIAHHYYQAAALGNTDKAVVYALRAAESAVRCTHMKMRSCITTALLRH